MSANPAASAGLPYLDYHTLQTSIAYAKISNTYRMLQVSTVGLLLWLTSTLSEPSVLLNGNWILISGPKDSVLESITVSADYLWGIDDSTGTNFLDNNVVYCQRSCGRGSSWREADPPGRLEEMVDANEQEVWGINNHGQIYKRQIDGRGDWIQISGGAHAECGPRCFSDVSVSNSGYIWAISKQNDTYMLCQNGVTRNCGNNDVMLIDDELSLVHIEAGDEEVWGINASNHIFKRLVNGSGAWSIVPGRMRFISASGNSHIWGIAPNNSLYMCTKPCTGGWEYVGGGFKQIDGDNNSVIGVTTNHNILAFCMEGKSIDHPSLQVTVLSHKSGVYHNNYIIRMTTSTGQLTITAQLICYYVSML